MPSPAVDILATSSQLQSSTAGISATASTAIALLLTSINLTAVDRGDSAGSRSYTSATSSNELHDVGGAESSDLFQADVAKYRRRAVVGELEPNTRTSTADATHPFQARRKSAPFGAESLHQESSESNRTATISGDQIPVVDRPVTRSVAPPTSTTVADFSRRSSKNGDLLRSSASSSSLLSWNRRKSGSRKSTKNRKRQRQRQQDVDGPAAVNGTDVDEAWTAGSGYTGSGNKRRRLHDTSGATADDSLGASYYVTAVLIVYSLSSVMLLASRISRKHTRLIEDRQTRKYLQEFQVVKERSARDMYRSMKKAVIAKLSRGGGGGGGTGGSSSSSSAAAASFMTATGGPPTISGGQFHAHRNIGRAMLPLVAVALPALPEEDVGCWTPDSNTGLLLSAATAGVTADSLSGSRRGSLSTAGGSGHLNPATLKRKRSCGAESSFSGSDGGRCRGSGKAAAVGSGRRLASMEDVHDEDDDDSSDDLYRTMYDE